jgi:uracil-DNA glycosylase
VHLAKQGVLLLNATLTVRAHDAGSHQKKDGNNLQILLLRLLVKRKKLLYSCFGADLQKRK